MTEDKSEKFLFDNPEAKNFVYRPPDVSNSNISINENATVGVKFAQAISFLDPWGSILIGKTKWQKVIFCLKHPIVYSKRWFLFTYRKIKRLFIKEKIWNYRLVPTKKNE